MSVVVGARPQFIKAAALSVAIKEINRETSFPLIEESLIHTGQHYDYEMSQAFFDELPLRAPSHNLEVGSAAHGYQTAQIMVGLEDLFERERPDAVVVFGDTNSTLAGALVAAKMHIPIAHIEAGMRSYDRRMPEEINRVVTDHLSYWLFCSSDISVKNLAREGLDSAMNVGDIMRDVFDLTMGAISRSSVSLDDFGLSEKRFVLVTIHRAENTDDEGRLRSLLAALEWISSEGWTVVFPMHPRTRERLAGVGAMTSSLRVIEPQPLTRLLFLMGNAHAVLTDSGGMQKEAYWAGVPCITLRDTTEWVETVELGWNRLVGADPRLIREAFKGISADLERPSLYGGGMTGASVVAALCNDDVGL